MAKTLRFSSVYLTDPVDPGSHICLVVSSQVVDSLRGLDVKHELVGHSARLVGQPRVHLAWDDENGEHDEDSNDDGYVKYEPVVQNDDV